VYITQKATIVFHCSTQLHEVPCELKCWRN